jgi:hypothetical protein
MFSQPRANKTLLRTASGFRRSKVKSIGFRKEVLNHAGCERIVYIDHIVGDGVSAFEHVPFVPRVPQQATWAVLPSATHDYGVNRPRPRLRSSAARRR